MPPASARDLTEFNASSRDLNENMSQLRLTTAVRPVRPGRQQDSPMPTRRRLLAALPVLTAFAAAPQRLLAVPLPELVVYGPPAAPSIVAARAVESGALQAVAASASFKVWRTPDEIRAGFASGRAMAAIVPTNVAANLYNRGLGVRLANVMTDGLLYIVGADPALDAVAKLRGRKLGLPFRNDMPDHVLWTLLRAAGLDPDRDLQIESLGSPPEAMQMLIAGRVDCALLSEPAASAAILQGSRTGRSLLRNIDLQQAWGQALGVAPEIPQAGLAVSASFAKDDPQRLQALNRALADATAWVLANPGAAGKLAGTALDLPPPVIERSIPHSHLRLSAATAARPSLEALFKVLAQRDAAIIGGRLPDAGFYAV